MCMCMHMCTKVRTHLLIVAYLLFTGDELSYNLKPSTYIFRAVRKIQEQSLVDILERNDPDAFEVFLRRGGKRTCAIGTASGAAGTSLAAEEVPAEEVPVCSSGASSSRSSVSTSVSSGGSTSRSS